ncbi:MAG: AAA family ATPase [Candidatus Nomurabacteria bacterium]|nr:MAG: AAA family ATPase [Candidatus Nomurabacteria bacterium]
MLDDLLLHPRTRQLADRLAINLPQGLIIDGPVGSGVASVAKALAKHLGSPELTLSPKKKVRGEFVVDADEGSVIIDDVRLLYQQTRTKQPGRHVYVIDTGNKSMTVSAQNAFLKLLEEPRNGLHFIIATHQFDQLLPTIVSRCQRLSLLAITDEQTGALINDLAIEDATKQTRLAFVGRGRPALIKRLAADSTSYDARVKIMSDAKTMLGSDVYEKLKIINTYRDSRSDALTLLDDMNHQLQIIIRSQPDQRIAKDIDKHLDTRRRIATGGNIRLQLSTDVL